MSSYQRKLPLADRILTSAAVSGPAYMRIPVGAGEPREKTVVKILETHLQTQNCKIVYIALSQFMIPNDFIEALCNKLNVRSGERKMLLESNFRYLIRHLAIKSPKRVLVFDNCAFLDKQVEYKLKKLTSSLHNLCFLIES